MWANYIICIFEQLTRSDMEARIQITASLSLSELAIQIKRHFSAKEMESLAKLIQDEDIEPSINQILSDLQEDYRALQKGTLKTRPAEDFLNDLKDEDLL
jgi:hypothetical protein